MKLRTTLIVIAALSVILGLGFVGVILVGRGVQSLRATLTSEAARQQFVAAWVAPSELTPETVLPARVGGLSLVRPESRVQLASLGLDREGAQGVYERPGALAIEVYVLRINELERDGLLQRARASFEKRPGGRTFLQINNRTRLSAGPPPETMEFWAMGDWLFLFRAAGDLPATFIRDYLAAVSRGQPQAPPPQTR